MDTALNPGDGPGAGPGGLPQLLSGIMTGLIWGTDRDAEMEKREMGGAFLFSCRKPPWCPGMSLILRPGLISSPEQAVSTPRAGRQE